MTTEQICAVSSLSYYLKRNWFFWTCVIRAVALFIITHLGSSSVLSITEPRLKNGPFIDLVSKSLPILGQIRGRHGFEDPLFLASSLMTCVSLFNEAKRSFGVNAFGVSLFTPSRCRVLCTVWSIYALQEILIRVN